MVDKKEKDKYLEEFDIDFMKCKCECCRDYDAEKIVYLVDGLNEGDEELATQTVLKKILKEDFIAVPHDEDLIYQIPKEIFEIADTLLSLCARKLTEAKKEYFKNAGRN